MNDQVLMIDNYRVNLEAFEGPLDLLLHLIKKNDLDIYNIPIAFVLEEYMKYIDTLRELDIDLAGEFLLMAADLAHIKSRMLLPEDKASDEDENEHDPRADLVRRLLEYQQYRDAAEKLEKREMLWRDVFVPTVREALPEAPQDAPIEANIYDLIEAFGRVLKKLPSEKYHEVATDRVSVNERILEIVDRIKQNETTKLADLLEVSGEPFYVVVTFLALLEMCRLRMIKVFQSERYGDLFLQRKMEYVKEDEALKLVSNYDGNMNPPA
ncbi:MAG: segregation/condensation protein A [Deltaproteobacteria bacterium]|nr:segregation/condensation protein A [Deltaproteobacteria bacterium]